MLRGEDHISNTPKQMMVIRALGGATPEYAHIPLILGEDKKRLSKRHGAASVEDLEAAGYLPRATVNALALLGWSFDDKTTIFTVHELIEGFSVGRISKSPAIFDLKKLQVLNGRHLRLMPNDEFTEALVGWLRDTGYLAERGPGAEELVRASAPLVKRKISTFADYDALAGWLFEPLEIQPEAWEVLTRDVKHSIQVIGSGLGRLESLPEFTAEAVKDALQDQLHVMGEAARDFLEPQRIAITGRLVSTGTYESLALLGRDEAFARYRADPGPARRAVGARVMFAPGTQRRLMLTAAWLFGIFLVVAFVFRRLDISEETDAIVAGVTAYVFLLAAAVILYRGWRQRDRDAGDGRDAVRGAPPLRAPGGRPAGERGPPRGRDPDGQGARPRRTSWCRFRGRWTRGRSTW